MPDLRDFDLLKTKPVSDEGLPDSESSRALGVWIAAVLLAVVAAITVYLVRGRRAAPTPPTPAAKAAQPAQQARPLGSDAQAIAVPPLNESDSIVRELVRKITSHPQALAWLATNDLIRNFTVVVANVDEGVTPAGHLRVLRPPSAFRVAEQNSEIVVDPRSYARYDGLAAAAASIDPAGASRLYATLKPRIEEAYAELGGPPASFDSALERAIVALLKVPAVDSRVRLYPKGIGYRFADTNLERLTPAQKQLLRAGPRNVQIIQSALRQLALALGIPPNRLP